MKKARSKKAATEKPILQLLIGLPGSGKSTWAEQQGKTVISSDAMRILLRDDVNDQSIHRETFALMRQVVRMRLRLGAKVTVVDATNLRRLHRRLWLRLAASLGAPCEAIWVDTPLDECLRRNADRTRVVPAEAILAMHAQMEPPSKAEGFTRIRRVRPTLPGPPRD